MTSKTSADADLAAVRSALGAVHGAGIFPACDSASNGIGAPIRLLGMSEKTRTFYQTYRWEGRYRTLRHWLYIVALLNLVCGLVDRSILDSATFVWAVIGRVVITAAFVLGALALYRLRHRTIEGFSVLAPCIVLFMVTGIVGLHISPVMLERYSVDAWFVVGSGVVLLRIDFVYTCLITLAALVILPIFIVVSDIQPDMAKAEIILFHAAAMLALWNAQRIQIRHRYQGILLSLKNEQQAQQLGEQAIQLRNLAATDQLTGIANRRCFNETCVALAPGLPIAVIMIDIDKFKVLNDRLGHIEGDHALQMVAQSIGNSVRQGELVARYGGEEFVVLARDKGVDDIVATAERIRTAVAALPCVSGFHLSVSAGVAMGVGADQAAVLRRADAALYDAKRLGRNRVVVDDETSLDMIPTQRLAGQAF